MATKLSWSHYSELLSIKDENELIYYINISFERNLSKRELREKIKNNEYQRIPFKSRTKLIKNEILKPSDLIPNPIKIKNGHNYENISEKALQN